MRQWVRNLSAFGALLTLMLGVTQASRADVIVFNNFGAANGGNDYQTGVGWTVGNDFSGNNIAVGDTFTPSTSGTLSQIVLALEFVAGPNAATVSLRADSGGLPGAVLESFGVSGLPPEDGNFHTPTTVNDVTNLALTAGTPYWVVVSSTSASSLSWMFSDSATGNHATSFDGGATWSASTDTQAAFRVTENLPQVTAPIPEPSSLALLGLGLGAFAGKWLRRRRR